jgi:plasmid stability protein
MHLSYFLTGAEAEGRDILVAVPMQNLTPQVQEAARGAPELTEVAAGEAAAATGGEEATAQPEPALEVVVRSQRSKTRSPFALRR